MRIRSQQKTIDSNHSDEQGIAILFALVVLGGLITLMLIIVQLIEIRTTAARNLYLTYQTAQEGQVNIPYADDAMASALWVPILEGYTGITKVASGVTTSTQNFDSDGDGANDDGTITLTYTAVAGGQDKITAFYSRTDNFLADAFDFLYPAVTTAAINATGSNVGFSVHVDMTSRTLGTSLSLSDLYSKFNIVEDASGDPSPLSDRAKLPYYLTGLALYTPRGAAWVKNCAANVGEMGAFSNKLAVDIEAYPGPPGNINGWCTNPWNLQKQELQARLTDYSVSYKKTIEAFLQILSESQNRVRVSVTDAPTSGGAITQTLASGAFVNGDVEIYNSISNMFSTALDTTSFQYQTVNTSVGGACGATATFNTNINWHPGARIRAAMRGMIGLPYNEIYFNNYENNSAGHTYLAPLPNLFTPSFPWATCSPYEFSAANHPIFLGQLPLNGTWGSSGLRFPQSGNTTVGATTRSWPNYYEVDATGAQTASVYTNPTVNNFAPCVFNDVMPGSSRRDLRGVFQNSYDACQSHKTTSGSTAPCATIVFAHGLPDLASSGAVPTCTTATTINYANHITEISTDLAAYDALENTYTILVFLDDGSNNALDKATFLALFDNVTHPDRFLINFQVPSPDSTFESSFLEVLQSLAVVIRERAVMQKL